MFNRLLDAQFFQPITQLAQCQAQLLGGCGAIPARAFERLQNGGSFRLSHGCGEIAGNIFQREWRREAVGTRRISDWRIAAMARERTPRRSLAPIREMVGVHQLQVIHPDRVVLAQCYGELEYVL